MYDWVLRLDKGAPAMDDLQGTLQIKSNHARQRSDPLMRRNVCTRQHLVRRPSPARYGTCGLG